MLIFYILSGYVISRAFYVNNSTAADLCVLAGLALFTIGSAVWISG